MAEGFKHLFPLRYTTVKPIGARGVMGGEGPARPGHVGGKISSEASLGPSSILRSRCPEIDTPLQFRARHGY